MSADVHNIQSYTSMTYWPNLTFPAINLWSAPRINDDGISQQPERINHFTYINRRLNMQLNNLKPIVNSREWVLFEDYKRKILTARREELDTATGNRIFVLQGEIAVLKEDIALRDKINR